MSSKKFTGNEGKFISSADAETLTKRFHKKKKKEGKVPQTYTEAQFFGKAQLLKLLGKDDCVGLRFYFGATEADVVDEQLVIVAVNADGKDLTSTRIGWKDMPAGNDALTDGPCCPHDCNPYL